MNIHHDPQRLWCVFLHHLTGGGASCTGATREAAIARAEAQIKTHPRAYRACSLPFETAPSVSGCDITHENSAALPAPSKPIE